MRGQIKIMNILFQDAGTYTPQYARPYEAVTTNDRMSALNVLENRIGQATRGNTAADITPGFISGIASGLVVPSAGFERELVIPSGWNERRLRFIMEVHVSGNFGDTVYYFQGYTDHSGVTMNGTLDPNMHLFVNSYIQVARAHDPSSPTGYTDRVVNSCQLIDGRFHSTTGGTVYGLRPEDVFTGIQSNYMQAGVSDYVEGEVVDIRINKARDVLQSKRNNEIPSNYLAKAITGHRNARSLADFGNDIGDIYSRSIQNSYEGTSFENPFLRALANSKGLQSVTSFTINDLIAMDPTVGSRTTYHRLAQTTRLHQVGDTDDNWSASTLTTQIATIVTHATSALMVECMLVRADIHATTYTLNGEAVVNISENFQSVSTSNLAPYLSNFINRFRTEVMPDATMNGQFNIDMRIRADLYGETYIDISIEGGAYETYVTPSFCDSIMSPVVTTNNQNYHDLINGIEEVINYASGDYSPSINQGFSYQNPEIISSI